MAWGDRVRYEVTLQTLLRGLPATVHGPGNPPVGGIAYDSRVVHPGDLFIAIRGFRHDGHAFAGDAVRRGAVAVVAERRLDLPAAVPQVVVVDSRLALAHLAAAFHAHPSQSLTLIGVTGTSGKGTTSHLIEAVLTAGGTPTGLIGTMGARIGAETVPLERTTPEAPDLQYLLRRMVDTGVRVVVMEVASHALALHRVAGCRFAGAVFTNLTLDHLDFHKTFDAYRDAKRMLFAMVEPDGFAVINADDPSGRVMAAASRAGVVTYGITHPAQVRAADLRLHLHGADFTLTTPVDRRRVRLRLHGRFNVYNALAALAVARALSRDLAGAIDTLARFAGVPGRFEAVDDGQPFGVVVDYAHKPDGLENVLVTARDFVAGRIIVVFGCGGDRDRTKRPVMGQIAARLADVAIVTSDNPRSEEPGAIIDEILAGIRESGAGSRQSQVEVEPDRRRAIRRAVELARPGDMVIIAGKGHETYQEIKGVKHPFDDRVVARDALKRYRESGVGSRESGANTGEKP